MMRGAPNARLQAEADVDVEKALPRDAGDRK
jgi:hypothetical protein